MSQTEELSRREEQFLENVLENLRQRIRKIAQELEEDLSPIRSICEAAEEFAPEYDWKKVMEKTGAYVEKKC